MALIRNINCKYQYWIRNNGLYVELTPEQKLAKDKARSDRMRASSELGAMLGQLAAHCPGAFERIDDMYKIASMF